MVTPALDGTLLSRSVVLPPRTCASGLIVRGEPAVAISKNGSAMIGTLPTARTVTARLPVVDSLPSDTVTETVFSPLVRPASEYTTVPSGVKLTLSGEDVEASVTYIGSPSGSTQSLST